MTACRYLTPEWLEESLQSYRSAGDSRPGLAKLDTSLAFRVIAEPAWGIEGDVLFGGVVEKGELQGLEFYREADAREQLEFIMSATPQEWKKILRRENKFLSDFMLGKISLEQGSKVRMISLAPYSGALVDILTQVELQFPDEMSAEELEEYRRCQALLRQELSMPSGV